MRASGTEICGPGPVLPTWPIQGLSRLPAPSANTTASSCPTRWCSKEGVVQRHTVMPEPATAIFSILMNAGLSQVCAWRRMPEGRCIASTVGAGIVLNYSGVSTAYRMDKSSIDRNRPPLSSLACLLFKPFVWRVAQTLLPGAATTEQCSSSETHFVLM